MGGAQGRGEGDGWLGFWEEGGRWLGEWLGEELGRAGQLGGHEAHRAAPAAQSSALRAAHVAGAFSACPAPAGLPRLQGSRAAHQEALAKEEAARRAAEQLVAEERAQRQRMLAAAASGNLPLLAAAGGSAGLATPGSGPAGGAAAVSPGLSPGGEAAAAGLSATELYSKYVEMHERYRAERLKNRQQEIVMEELCSEVEKRAALVKEQQVGAGVGWGGGRADLQLAGRKGTE